MFTKKYSIPKHKMPATVDSLQLLMAVLVIWQSVNIRSVPPQLILPTTVGTSPEPKLDPLMA